MYSEALVKEMSESFSVISNLAVTTPIDCRLIFSKESLNLNKSPSLQVDIKTTLNLDDIFFWIMRLKRAVKSSEDLPV